MFESFSSPSFYTQRQTNRQTDRDRDRQIDRRDVKKVKEGKGTV